MYYESEGRDGDDNDDNNDNDDNDGSLLVEQRLLFRKMERKQQKEREACSHPVYRAPHTYMYLNSLFRFLLSLPPSPLSPSPSPSPFSTQVQSEARLLAAQKEQVSISSFLNVSPALQNKHMQTTLATVEVVSVVRLQDFPTEHQPSILALGARYYIPTYRCYVCT